MATLRILKRDINYLMDEVVTDSYLSLYFHPEHKDAIVGVIRGAVDLRNSLYERANNPAEKHSRTLVRRHYAALRRDMFDGVDALFVRLSEIGK
jgi:hypothetical protein